MQDLLVQEYYGTPFCLCSLNENFTLISGIVVMFLIFLNYKDKDS